MRSTGYPTSRTDHTTPEEERLADEHALDPEVAEHEREMAERGEKQEGEGRIP